MNFQLYVLIPLKEGSIGLQRHPQLTEANACVFACFLVSGTEDKTPQPDAAWGVVPTCFDLNPEEVPAGRPLSLDSS